MPPWTTESIPSGDLPRHVTPRVYNSVPVRGETGSAPGKRELRGGLTGAGTWRDGPGTGGSRAGAHPG
jgi:hypothetical protein